MGNVQFRNGKVLFTASGAVAMDPRCCCATGPCTKCNNNLQSAMSVSASGSGPPDYILNVMNHVPSTFQFCSNNWGAGGDYPYNNRFGCTWAWWATFDLGPLGLPGYVFSYLVVIGYDVFSNTYDAWFWGGTCPAVSGCDDPNLFWYGGASGWCSNDETGSTLSCGSDGKLHGSIAMTGVHADNGPNQGTWTVTATLP